MRDVDVQTNFSSTLVATSQGLGSCVEETGEWQTPFEKVISTMDTEEREIADRLVDRLRQVGHDSWLNAGQLARRRPHYKQGADVDGLQGHQGVVPFSVIEAVKGNPRMAREEFLTLLKNSLPDVSLDYLNDMPVEDYRGWRRQLATTWYDANSNWGEAAVVWFKGTFNDMRKIDPDKSMELPKFDTYDFERNLKNRLLDPAERLLAAGKEKDTEKLMYLLANKDMLTNFLICTHAGWRDAKFSDSYDFQPSPRGVCTLEAQRLGNTITQLSKGIVEMDVVRHEANRGRTFVNKSYELSANESFFFMLQQVAVIHNSISLNSLDAADANELIHLRDEMIENLLYDCNMDVIRGILAFAGIQVAQEA